MGFKVIQIDVPLKDWTAEDVVQAVSAAPSAICGPAAEEATLLKLKPCKTFAELLTQLYPTHAGDLAAAGRLAERLAEARSTTVAGGLVNLDQSSSVPTGHVGVVGDLQVNGDLEVVGALVVTGNLRVNGRIIDCGPQSRIVVLGDLRCHHMHSSGWVTVVGEVQVDGLLFGKYNDDAFEAHGTISAGLILSDDHGFESEQGFDVRYQPPEDGAWGSDVFDLADSQHVASLRSILGASVIDDDGSLEWDAVPDHF